ncbi:hypothetical protein NJT12_24435 [Flavobacterium sp. AC]|uniref:Uncharacterized protein n=1 Tax=Flavobacterium azizsancarii TaxID=2961580 RepID=A0ABT4WLP5_9FLAO|nr:hypothetical protein [Flavobacterium azizsancarii]MDA6072775.1 hypothetical protein [Flavobacterium azizsancarii]
MELENKLKKHKMAKKTIEIGNVYKIIHDNEVRYFQYFYSDPHYLGGDLIWVFNQKEETQDLDEIVGSGYSFYFYTAIEAGIKMKKWKFLSNLEIPKEMKFHPIFRWRDLETGNWYELQYDQKHLLGINLDNDQLKIPIVSFQFPVGAVEFILNGIDYYTDKTTDFEKKYFERNKKF